MALEKKPARVTRPIGASFRFSEGAFNQLKALASVLNMSQVEVLEALIQEEFNKCKKKYPREMQRALETTKKT